MMGINLITLENLAFSKPSCGCGLISSKQRQKFIKQLKNTNKTKKNYKSKTKKQTQNDK